MSAKSLSAKLFKNNTPKRILALDGGGVRGALTLGFLERIEELLRARFSNKDIVLSDYYDLIGGTSTGAIISSCLALGKPVQEVISLYRNFGEKIFGRRRYSFIPRGWTTTRAFLSATYKSSTLESLLRDNLQEVTIGDTESIKCGLAITSKRADTYSLWTVANHPEGIYYTRNSDLKLWELCRASSAAPYYFTPKKLLLNTRKGLPFEAAFIDGGVSLANNPAFQLFLTATIPSFGFVWQTGEKNIFITSIGTGHGVKQEEPKQIVKRRAVAWAPKIPELFMTDALEMNQAILQLFGRDYAYAEGIDSQYENLGSVNFTEEKLFSFSRFSVTLSVKELEKIGFKSSREEVNSLIEMDHYENIDALLEIGRKAAERVSNGNIPNDFDF